MRHPTLRPRLDPGEAPPARAFDGETYRAETDFDRLRTQLERVLWILADYRPHRLDEIAREARSPSTAGITARIRDLRKAKHGGHAITSYRDPFDSKSGLWWYRLLRPAPRALVQLEFPLPPGGGAPLRERRPACDLRSTP